MTDAKSKQYFLKNYPVEQPHGRAEYAFGIAGALISFTALGIFLPATAGYACHQAAIAYDFYKDGEPASGCINLAMVITQAAALADVKSPKENLFKTFCKNMYCIGWTAGAILGRSIDNQFNKKNRRDASGTKPKAPVDPAGKYALSAD